MLSGAVRYWKKIVAFPLSEKYRVIAMDTGGHGECMDRLVLNGANLNGGGVRPSVQLPVEIGYRIAKRFAGKSRKARDRYGSPATISY